MEVAHQWLTTGSALHLGISKLQWGIRVPNIVLSKSRASVRVWNGCGRPDIRGRLIKIERINNTGIEEGTTKDNNTQQTTGLQSRLSGASNLWDVPEPKHDHRKNSQRHTLKRYKRILASSFRVYFIVASCANVICDVWKSNIKRFNGQREKSLIDWESFLFMRKESKCKFTKVSCWMFFF